MSDLAAIQASYADFKLVKTRSAAQIVLELPIEEAERFLQIFGVPLPGKERPVAIALLREELVPQSADQDNAMPPANLERRGQLSQQAKERYRRAPEWQKAAMRASILCGEIRFRQWLWDRYWTGDDLRSCPDDEGWAAIKVRGLLGVTSRSEIGTDREVYDRFIALETQYKLDTNQMAEVRE